MAETATKRDEEERNSSIRKSIILTMTSEDHETATTDVSSSEDSRTKEQDCDSALPLDAAHDGDDRLKTCPNDELVEKSTPEIGPRSSISKLLCCVNDEDLARYGASDFHPLPTACRACVAMWTEKTRERFERNIESLLSTVDSSSAGRGHGGDEPKSDAFWSQGFEKRYRVIIKNSLTSLREAAEKEEAERNAAAEANSSDDDDDCAAPRHRRNLLGFPRNRENRLRWMRRKMPPQLNHGQDESPVRKAQSFDDHVLRNHRHVQPPRTTRSCQVLSNSDCVQNGGKKHQLLGISHALQHACECGGSVKSVPEDTGMHYGDRSLLDDEDAGYDSDPEFIQTHRYSADILAPIRSYDDSESNIAEAPDEDKEETENKENEGALIDFNDPENVSQLIEEVMHGSMTLIWHPSQTPETSKIQSPTCVKAWIELGCRVKGQIIQPKLVWRKAYHHGAVQLGIVTAPESLRSVDILDIARILTSQEIDREQYPLAKKSKSFTIVTTENVVHLFEVADAAERDRIVSGLKLLVARLASLIIVGDKKLFDDFFYPTTSSDFQKKFCGDESSTNYIGN